MTTAVNTKKLAEQELASRVLSKRRLMPFVKRLNPKYLDGWVHRDIAERLERFSEDVAKGLSPRLMLLVPPRHGKSELASKNFPPWHLGRYPDHEFIACSYNIDLARDFSRAVKGILAEPGYQSVFDTRLDPDNQSAESWRLTNGVRGGYVAAGIGGGITGKGAHVLLIDDPIKNAEEADSADNREKIFQWYLSTAYSRLAPGGGVLIIQCMTGDTPVLLPDGTTKRLDALQAGDVVATYEDGRLSSSRVAAVKSNGRDFVSKITTSSGKIVRSNERHPFLVSGPEGLKWIRARSLTTAHKIVAVSSSGVSGRAQSVSQEGVTHQSSAAATALPTTTRKSGLTDTAPRRSTQPLAALPTSNTATASPPKTTLASLMRRAGRALSAATKWLSGRLPTGAATCALTTATSPTKFVDCSAMTATLELDTLALSALHSRWLNTSEFTTDQIVSVEWGGVEEVFDVQIDRTENFIANGLVSHNTWWHDDDLAGRLQIMMRDAIKNPDDENSEFTDQFDVVKYPAIAEADEYMDEETNRIVYDQAPEKGRLLRRLGEALHPARYDLNKLLRIKAQNKGGRWWSALYQQNPVPDDGGYFSKEQFKKAPLPHSARANLFVAFDFAISEKKQNDYTVGAVGLQDEDDVLHIAEVLRYKSSDSLFIVDSILGLCKRWYHPSLILGVEDGQIWRAMESLFKKRCRETKFYPSITVLKPITDKMARGRVLQGRMQQGMVSFNEKGQWFDACRAEMLRFPAGVHDDQVDTLAWMAQMAVGREPPQKLKQKGYASWRDKLKTSGTTGRPMTA